MSGSTPSISVEVSLPEALRGDDAAVRTLMASARDAAQDVVEVVRGGWTGRRASADVAPLVVVGIVIAQAALREVAGGFLQAVGAEGLAAIKRMVGNLIRMDAGGCRAEVRVEIRTRIARDGEEASHEVAISLPHDLVENPDGVVDRVLDEAFSRADQLFGGRSSDWIVYDAQSGRWESQSERLAGQRGSRGK